MIIQSQISFRRPRPLARTRLAFWKLILKSIPKCLFNLNRTTPFMVQIQVSQHTLATPTSLSTLWTNWNEWMKILKCRRLKEAITILISKIIWQIISSVLSCMLMDLPHNAITTISWRRNSFLIRAIDSFCFRITMDLIICLLMVRCWSGARIVTRTCHQSQARCNNSLWTKKCQACKTLTRNLVNCASWLTI